jgi:hypothetical protein
VKGKEEYNFKGGTNQKGFIITILSRKYKSLLAFIFDNENNGYKLNTEVKRRHDKLFRSHL